MEQQQWTINFGPGGFTTSGFVDPEEIRRQQIAQLQQLIDDQRCVMCKNTYLVNDQITMCSIKNECVDNEYGKYCENWDPIKIQ